MKATADKKHQWFTHLWILHAIALTCCQDVNTGVKVAGQGGNQLLLDYIRYKAGFTGGILGLVL